MTDWSAQTQTARAWFEHLRDAICGAFEGIEREAGSDASFEYTPGRANPWRARTATPGRRARGDEGQGV
jgi:coproporphyrinogen III oxidase